MKKIAADVDLYFQDVTQNENWNNCLDTNGQSLARCIYNCKDDESCEADCVGQFKVKTDDCPCEVSRQPSLQRFIAYFRQTAKEDVLVIPMNVMSSQPREHQPHRSLLQQPLNQQRKPFWFCQQKNRVMCQ